MKSPTLHLVDEVLIDVVEQGRFPILLVQKGVKFPEPDSFKDNLAQYVVGICALMKLVGNFIK